MFIMSRDTTINKGVVDSAAAEDVKRHVIQYLNDNDHQFITIQRGVYDDWFVLGLAEGPYINPKPFAMPIKFDYGDDTFIVVDVRSSTRFDRGTAQPVISNQPLFRRDMIRTLIESIWVGNGANDILNLGHYQIQVFATWVAEMFTRRFALDAEQQVRLSVLAAFYYLCLFADKDTVDLRRFLSIITKVTNTNTVFVMDTLRDVDHVSTIDEFLALIIRTLNTDRLAGLGVDVFITLLAGSWFGPNHAVMVGVALEYPPMWNTLLYLSLTDRTTRASGIAKIALRRERDAMAREYVSLMSRTLIANSTLMDNK